MTVLDAHARIFLWGEQAKPPPSCPSLDPLASIQISDELIHIYLERIDALINQLGKNVVLEFDPILTPCTNCVYDPIGQRSKGVYNGAGPSPFPSGRQCPVCRGKGVTEQAVTRCIKALIKWAPKDAAGYGVSIQDSQGMVRTKCFLTEAPWVTRCKSAVIHHDTQGTALFRVQRASHPVAKGLRERRYLVTFWKLVQT